jgi:L-fuculose-phosphate aldolase
MEHFDLRREIIDTALEMNRMGINQGTSGNVSVRVPGGMLITPSGVPYEELGVQDIVFMASNGEWQAIQGRKPSSEWRFHLDIYNNRPDAGAIVHTHALHCTALSMLRKDIPACHYMIGFAGGNSVRCADYATFGTQELSNNALKALEGRRACLLANHGMIVFWDTLKRALWLANEIEVLASQYWRALQVGEPHILSDEEMEIIVAKFGSGYGMASKAAEGQPAGKPGPASRKKASAA